MNDTIQQINSEDDARTVVEEIAVLMAGLEKRRRMVFKWVRIKGGFTHAGLSIFNQQTIGYVYDPEIAAHAIEQAGIPLEYIISNCVDPRALKRLIEKSDYSETLQAILQSDDSGGMIKHFGDAKIDVRSSPPDDGKHFVVRPGEKPIPTGGE